MPYQIVYEGKKVRFPDREKALAYIREKETSKAPSYSPPVGQEPVAPTSAEPTPNPTGAYDKLTQSAKIALSPSSQAQIGPATSPVRTSPTVTAMDAIKAQPTTPSLPGLFGQGISNMARFDNAARAVMAGPGSAGPGEPYKTTGAKVVEALQGKDISGLDAVKGLRDKGYLNKTTQEYFEGLPAIAQDIITSPTTFLGIPGAKPAASALKGPVKNLLKLTKAERQMAKSTSKELQVAAKTFSEKVAEHPFMKSLEANTSGDGAIPALKPVDAKFKQISNIRLNVARGLFSPKSTLNKMGEMGKELVNKIENVRYKESSQLGEVENKLLKYVKPLTPEEYDNFINVFDKGVKPANERVSAAVDAIMPSFQDVRSQSITKLKNFRPIETYFPHIRPKEVVEYWKAQSPKLYEEAQKMVREGDSLTVGDAVEAILTNQKYRGVRDTTLEGYRPASNLEFNRTMQGGEWRKDKEVLADYFRSAYRRLSEVDEFGLADKKANHLINAIKQQFGDDAGQYAQDAFRAAIGDYKVLNSAEKKIAGGLGSFQVVTKLGLAQIVNLGQTNNTYIRTNLGSTLKGVAQMFSKDNREFARAAGAFTDSIAEELAGSNSVGNTFLKWSGFKGTEFWNRGVAALAGKNYAMSSYDDLVGEAVKHGYVKQGKTGYKIVDKVGLSQLTPYKRLQELKLDTNKLLKQGFMDLETQKRAAYRVVEDTQFSSHAENLPLLWQSPGMKVAMQFKSFAFQHGKFMLNHVLKKAAEGDVKPLLKAVVSSATLGEVVRDTKKTVSSGFTKNEFSELMAAVDEAKNGNVAPILKRQLMNFFQLGGFGLYTDMVEASKYGKGSVSRFLGGPTLSDSEDFLQPILSSAQPLLEGELPTAEKLQSNAKNLAKQGVRRLPVVGSPLKNILFSTPEDEKDEKKKPFGAKRKKSTKKKKPFGG